MFGMNMLRRFFASTKRPRVFFDVSIDNQKAGRMVFEVLTYESIIEKLSFIQISFPRPLKTSEDSASEMLVKPRLQMFL